MKHFKKGYKCIKWENAHNLFITENYNELNNLEIAIGLNQKFKINRTEDAVRKQLNKLKLKRQKKGELKALNKLEIPDKFFKNIQIGLNRRKLLDKAELRQELTNKKMIVEKEAVSKIYGTEQIKKEATTEKDLVWVRIDDKTRIQVKRGMEKIMIEKFIQKENEKWN